MLARLETLLRAEGCLLLDDLWLSGLRLATIGALDLLGSGSLLKIGS
jgi:hypothetical protein